MREQNVIEEQQPYQLEEGMGLEASPIFIHEGAHEGGLNFQFTNANLFVDRDGTGVTNRGQPAGIRRRDAREKVITALEWARREGFLTGAGQSRLEQLKRM